MYDEILACEILGETSRKLQSKLFHADKREHTGEDDSSSLLLTSLCLPRELGTGGSNL